MCIRQLGLRMYCISEALPSSPSQADSSLSSGIKYLTILTQKFAFLEIRAILEYVQKHDQLINVKVMYKHTKDKENDFICYLRNINSSES